MNILPKSQYEKIFNGSQITTQHIKLVLEEAGISSIIRDDVQSALRGGSPLLMGETLSTLRIVASSGIILFCSWAIVSHFKQKKA